MRQVEWLIEQASELPASYPHGQPLCSKPFDAAGLEGLQFHFYPTGYTGAADGYCSCFLYAPAGTTLKCWLQVGNQRREVSHEFEDAGCFGRTNFCIFERCIRKDTNSLLITLDIDDAQQDLVAWESWKAEHAGVVAAPDTGQNAFYSAPTERPVSPRTRINTCGPEQSPAHSRGSIVKLHHVSSRPARGILEEVKVLPSLWAAQPNRDDLAKAVRPRAASTGALAGKLRPASAAVLRVTCK